MEDITRNDTPLQPDGTTNVPEVLSPDSGGGVKRPEELPGARRARRERERQFKEKLLALPDPELYQMAVGDPALRDMYIKEKGDKWTVDTPDDPLGVVDRKVDLYKELVSEYSRVKLTPEQQTVFFQKRLQPDVAARRRTELRQLAMKYPEKARELVAKEPYLAAVVNGTAEDVRKSQWWQSVFGNTPRVEVVPVAREEEKLETLPDPVVTTQPDEAPAKEDMQMPDSGLQMREVRRKDIENLASQMTLAKGHGDDDAASKMKSASQRWWTQSKSGQQVVQEERNEEKMPEVVADSEPMRAVEEGSLDVDQADAPIVVMPKNEVVTTLLGENTSPTQEQQPDANKPVEPARGLFGFISRFGRR